jgi:hypothetical protein
VALDLIGAFFILVPATDVFAFDATKTNLVCFLSVCWYSGVSQFYVWPPIRVWF